MQELCVRHYSTETEMTVETDHGKINTQTIMIPHSMELNEFMMLDVEVLSKAIRSHGVLHPCMHSPPERS